MIPATEALERLQQGNQRFITNATVSSPTLPDGTVPEQKPFAIILGCSDARVPAELIFDHGLGDLFIIRVAGNIVAPSQIGSIEFAAEKFGTRLVVVMGHSHCGAIAATLQELQQPTGVASPNLASIVDHIRPAVEPLAANPDGLDQAALQQEAMRANVRASVTQLQSSSTLLNNLAQNNGLQIIGAEYSIETGLVGFYN
ncbi:MAG: carbonic anhydrase [Verrucomicrobiales bacterium]|nr:carbonic anhydrase [Verrucomicrobiales bacterium]